MAEVFSDFWGRGRFAARNEENHKHRNLAPLATMVTI